MSDTVIAVLKENESELQSWLVDKGLTVKYRLIIAETLILSLSSKTNSVWSATRGMAEEKGWAYNMVYFKDETDYWPGSTQSVRFDYQGNKSELSNKSPGNTEIRQVLHQMITTEPNDPRLKDRLFHAYLLRFEWENQLENGRLHAMRKLIGGL